MELEFSSVKEVEEYLKNLSNEDIANRLKALNCKSGPVTKSTRLLYNKRLKDILISTLRIGGDAPPNSDQITNGDNSEEHVSNKQTENQAKIIETPNAETYFGVQVPSIHNKEGPFIFKNRAETVKFSKTYPGSRFKMFADEEEARKFSAEVNFNAVSFTKLRDGQKLDESSDLVYPSSPPSPAPKESLPFSSIKCSEFVMLRKALETGDVQRAKELIWSNPRFLIGNGDNPTVLQEGCRYNALHVCCKSNQLESCRLIVDTITDLDFYQRLYKDEMPEKRQARLDFLVDMYLNNREKGAMETPLHFACKFGFEELVKYLLKQTMIDRNALNSAGQKPFEIISTRAKDSNIVLKKRIEDAFEDPYYVFIIRSEDNSEPPQVSHPFCPYLPSSSSIILTNTKARSFKNFFAPPTHHVKVNSIKMNVNSHAKNSECPKENGFVEKNIDATSGLVNSEQASSEVNGQWSINNNEKSKENSILEDTISQGDACNLEGNFHFWCSNLSYQQGDCDDSVREPNDLEKKLTAKELKLPCNKSSANPELCTPRLNGILKHSSDHFKTPPRHPTPLNTLSNLNGFRTPKNLANGKVSVLCKTPTNKQLILLAEAGSENFLSPYALPKGERFSTPVSKGRSNLEQTPSKSLRGDKDHWEKILNTPIFTPWDIPKKIRGVAGPMSKNKCGDFREKVLLRDADGTEYSNLNCIRRTDSNKGLERICRQIAKSMGVLWSEYWDFLECDVDLTTEEGLDLLEGHLKNIVEFSVSVCEDRVNLEDPLSKVFSKLSIKSPPSNINKRLHWSDEEDSDEEDSDEEDNDEEDSDEEDNDEVFLDARAKLEDGEEFYELNSRYNNGMFIFGDLPTRSDLDAFRAVMPIKKHLKAYPSTYSWFTNVKSFSEAERTRWPDAASVGHMLSNDQSCHRDLLASIRNYDLCYSPSVSSPGVARDLRPQFREG